MTYQRNIDLSEDGVDERLPDRVQQAEIAAGDQYEHEHDERALTDLAPVWPLHTTQLVDDVAEEGDETTPLRAAVALSLGLAARRALGGEVALEVVGGAIEVGELVDVVELLAHVGRDRAGLGHARLFDVGEGVLRRRRGRRPATAAALPLLRTLTIAGHASVLPSESRG